MSSSPVTLMTWYPSGPIRLESASCTGSNCTGSPLTGSPLTRSPLTRPPPPRAAPHALALDRLALDRLALDRLKRNRLPALRGNHHCITSPVWHCRAGTHAVQRTNDHVPLQPVVPLTPAARHTFLVPPKLGQPPRAPYTGGMVLILAPSPRPVQIIKTRTLGRYRDSAE